MSGNKTIGGAFNPYDSQTVFGDTTFSGAVTLAGTTTITGAQVVTAGTAAGSVATIDGTQTLTNKTLTSPTINTPTIATATMTGTINSEAKVLAADAALSSSTLATLTGLSWTVVASGVYQCVFEGPVTMTTNGGLTMALKFTTATLTAVAIEAKQFTASAIAVAANFTTATDQAKFIDQKTTAYTAVEVTGAIFVNAGGTIGLQAAQNTTHADTTTVLKGFRASLVRVS